MPWQAGAAAAIFAATFLLLAAGRIGRQDIPRGLAALAGGAATAAVLGTVGAIDWQVILLLAGLMALAAAADASGAFDPLRRALATVPLRLALVLACACMAGASALLLNDAAVVVLIPVLLPVLRLRGIDGVAAVVWLAVAANVGSLLTPFGNPQNAVLARAGELGVIDFLRQQAVVFAAAALLMAVPVLRCGAPARAKPQAHGMPAAQEPEQRAWADSRDGQDARVRLGHAIWLPLAAFVAAAVAWPAHLGTAAAAAAVGAYVLLRPAMARKLERRMLGGIDLNVLALFFGLYLLMGGLDAWFPAHLLAPQQLDSAARAVGVVLVAANLVGNVPTILALLALDAAWVAAHAPFLVSLSTLGGSVLLTGSAATLLAAEAGRRHGVVVSFAAYARHAAPWMAIATAFAAWWMW